MRDTDIDWNEIAKKAPYYGVLSYDEFRESDTAALEKFFKTGKDDVNYCWNIFNKIFGEFCPSSALDFGCGTGRLMVAMQERIERVVGVDIAEEMRRICSDNMISARAKNFEIFKEIPENQRFDWVNSLIVLQHIPPILGYKLIKKLWDATREGGYLSIQFTIYHDLTFINKRLDEFTNKLLEKSTYITHDGERISINIDLAKADVGTVMMFDYNLGYVISLLDLKDRTPIFIEHTNHGGHRGVWLFVRKPASHMTVENCEQ